MLQVTRRLGSVAGRCSEGPSLASRLTNGTSMVPASQASGSAQLQLMAQWLKVCHRARIGSSAAPSAAQREPQRQRSRWTMPVWRSISRLRRAGEALEGPPALEEAALEHPVGALAAGGLAQARRALVVLISGRRVWCLAFGT